MTATFVFTPDDNPMQLSKVGNWVITFVGDDPAAPTVLALTHVIPRQQSTALQPRRLIIQQLATNQHAWSILSIEYYNAHTQHDEHLALDHEQANHILNDIIQEFKKYDVELSLE